MNTTDEPKYEKKKSKRREDPMPPASDQQPQRGVNAVSLIGAGGRPMVQLILDDDAVNLSTSHAFALALTLFRQAAQAENDAMSLMYYEASGADMVTARQALSNYQEFRQLALMQQAAIQQAARPPAGEGEQSTEPTQP